MSKPSIPVTDEAWDERDLGADEDFVAVAEDITEDVIEEAAGTKMISIRLQKSVIEDFKLIASLNGTIGYQTLMKQILHRFVDCEKKRLFRELATEKVKEQEAAQKSVETRTPQRQKKVA
ncbi:MAG: hypothetical protein HY778_06200 [Betaproteobacteria bacterium]|nr:hypothetical protein [Betaproteobacteria bacterium]